MSNAGESLSRTTKAGVKFTACSAKHKSCSPAHAALVASFREERQRQEEELNESQDVLGYTADRELHFARGGKALVTFKDFLKANKKSPAQLAEEAAFRAEQKEIAEIERLTIAAFRKLGLA